MPEKKSVTVVCVGCGREEEIVDPDPNWDHLVHPEKCPVCLQEMHVRPEQPDLVNITEDQPTVAYADNRFWNRKTGVTHSEDHTEELVDVKPFKGPVAYVRRGYGLTLNLGDFESARFDVSITVPCYMEDAEAADRWAEKWAEERISKEVRQVRGSQDKKVPEKKGPAF